MNWIFDHLQVVIALAAAFAYWFNQRKEKAAAEKEAGPGEGGFEVRPSETEDLERTRRIQEEIRRKIAERQGGELPPPLVPAPMTRPLASPVAAPRPAAGHGGGLREKLEAKLAQAQARERERQLEARRRLAEAQELAEQEAALANTLTARAVVPAEAVVQRPVAEPVVRASRSWVDDLRDPQSVRRAMVLREVLGAPVGLR